MIKDNYDLIVIGGGPAGTPVAIEYAKLNPDKTVALVDLYGKLGGECLFQGCIPSKILEESAHAIKSLKKLQNFGIDLDDKNYKLIWEDIKSRKTDILDKRNGAATDFVNDLENIDLIKANAKFSSQNSVELVLDDTTKEVSFSRAVIGTGSRSFVPQYAGNGSEYIWTNSDFFAKMELPTSLSIIGTGAIAVELASILSELGVKINLFGRSKNILTNIDNEASQYLYAQLKNNSNINLVLEASIDKVDFENDTFTIEYTQNSQTKNITSHRVLSAAGRIPNLDTLDLEKAEVEFSKKGIQISSHLQTSNKNIFANGDVVEGFPKFAHTAQYGAHTIAQNLFLEHNFFSIDYDKNSWVLFTMPNVMMAGISQKEAKERNLDVIVDKFEFSTEAKSQIANEDYGYLKFIVEKKTNTIIGISMLHEKAYNMGGEAALIISKSLKLKDLIDSIHPHPTNSEAFVMLAKQMMGNIMIDKLKKPLVQAALKVERWL